jgi:hypothetical protein
LGSRFFGFHLHREFHSLPLNILFSQLGFNALYEPDVTFALSIRSCLLKFFHIQTIS